MLLLLVSLILGVQAHTAWWVKGMYCLNVRSPLYDVEWIFSLGQGTTDGTDNNNNNQPVDPIYMQKTAGWWMNHVNGCDAQPPDASDFLLLPAGGTVTGEYAHNRAFTTLSYSGSLSEWPDGKWHPEDWHSDGDECLDDGAMHTHNQSTASGTALAISYNSELSQVTMENLVVFSVLANAPWKRVASFEVPADLPPCPAGGCICVHVWVPGICGEPNIYINPYRCQVTGWTSTKKLASAQPPTYCGGNSNCVQGAKQIIIYNQLEGNNTGDLLSSDIPGYNQDNGFRPGAQTDIFQESSTYSALPTPSPLLPPTYSSLLTAMTSSDSEQEKVISTQADSTSVNLEDSSAFSLHSLIWLYITLGLAACYA